ncbi:hypothetical protein ACFPM0_32255 [Pseudonocardia sulfidoxydans]|uniref:hypothetical protein n=1 Tax=Pseudonocardia sulfidoxydans TaxID=54011 RepID=UPI003612B9BE
MRSTDSSRPRSKPHSLRQGAHAHDYAPAERLVGPRGMRRHVTRPATSQARGPPRAASWSQIWSQAPTQKAPGQCPGAF